MSGGAETGEKTAIQLTDSGRIAMNKPAGSRKFFAQCACCPPAAAFEAAMSRRNFLSGSAGAAPGLAPPTDPAPAPAQTAKKLFRADGHHHVVPPMQKPLL